MKLLSGKILILLGIIIAAGYLVSKFPDEAILVTGIAMIIVIGIWIHQAHQQRDN